MMKEVTQTIATNLGHTLKLSSVLVLSSILAACGSESNTQEPEQVKQPVVEAAKEGQVMIAMTDAEEDFLSYTVEVEGIQLTKENGDVIEVLPESTNVDFVDYQQLTEVFSVIKAPVGKYQSITMELDYSEAYILIQNEAGESFEAQAVDAEQNLLTNYQVQFSLAPDQPLEVSETKLSQLTLDLDLSASNTILSFDPAQVQVEPFVIGEASINEQREHRVRGTLTSVDEANNTLTINLQPMRKFSGDFGESQVVVNDSTEIEIDGVVVTLADAISSLANQDPNYPVIAYGQIETPEGAEEGQFVATQLLAGTSIPWVGKDVAKGMITKLEEGVAYLSGVTINAERSAREFVMDAALVVDEQSQFVGKKSMSFDQSYLVPGQQVKALGAISSDETSTSIDASGDIVRILPSTVLAQVDSVSEDQTVTLDVVRFNKRPNKLIKRSGSEFALSQVNMDGTEFADLALVAGDWVSVTGYMAPAQEGESISQIDANKVKKYDMSNSEVKYSAHWGRSGTELSVNEEGNLVFDVTNGRHKMNYRFNPVNMMPEVEQMVMVSGETVGKYALRLATKETVFFDSYAALVTELQTNHAEAAINSVFAKGHYDAENNQYTVIDITVKLN